jgi:hypothetical protein
MASHPKGGAVVADPFDDGRDRFDLPLQTILPVATADPVSAAPCNRRPNTALCLQLRGAPCAGERQFI